MTPDLAIDLGRRTLEVALLLSAPMLVSSLVVGLLISIFQAATQINEVTLTFVPKILVVFLALVFFLPWMLRLMIGFTTDLFVNIPGYIH